MALETLREGPVRAVPPTRRRCCSGRPTARRSTRPTSTRTPPSSARPKGSRRPPWPGRPRTARRRLQRGAWPTTRPPTRRSTTSRGRSATPRTTAAPDGTEALVGGTTSIFVDLQDAMNRDYSIVFPVAALIIMLILALLLRSLVAPWYLMASVGLGFAATLGATVIVFQHVMGDAGPDLHAADLHLPVRGRPRHRLQHLDDRPAPRGGARRPRAAPGRGQDHRARRPDGRRGRRDPRRHLRLADAGGNSLLHVDGLRARRSASSSRRS